MFGGRPMVLIKPDIFMDVIAKKSVSIWMDKKNRYWMSTSRWGWFRVPLEKEELEESPQNAK